MGNPLSRFLDLIRNPSSSRTTSLLVILVIALSVPLTVFVAQTQQELRQRAECVPTTYEACYTIDGSDLPREPDIKCSPGGSMVCPLDPAEKSYICQKTCQGTISQPAISQQTCQQLEGRCERGNCSSGRTLSTEGICPGKDDVCCKIPSSVPSGPSVGGTVCNTVPWTIGSCQGTPVGTTQDNPTPCNRKCPDGRIVQGKSVRECQSNLCWYDSYYDPNPAKAPKEQWCYAEPGKPDPCAGPTAPATPITCAGQVGNATRQCVPQGQCTSSFKGTLVGQDKSCGNQECCDVVSCSNLEGAECLAVSACPQGKVEQTRGWCSTQGVCCKTTTPVAPATTNTQLTFTLGLDGLGTTGDFKTSNSSGSNKNPGRTSRKLFYQVFDSSINQVAPTQGTGEGTVSYDLGSGKFKASVNLGKVLANGTYIIKVRPLGYKTRIIRNVSITSQTTEIRLVNLPTGDVDGDLNISTLDHDILLSCWGIRSTDLSRCASNPSFREMADLDDNGEVNQFDYNLFLRDFSAGQKEEE